MSVADLQANIEVTGMKTVKKDANTAKTVLTDLSDALEIAVLNLMQFQDETLNSGAGLNILQEGAQDMAGAVDKGVTAVVTLGDVLQRQNTKLQETVSAVDKVSTSMTEMAGGATKAGDEVVEMANKVSKADEDTKGLATTSGRTEAELKALDTTMDKTGDSSKKMGDDIDKSGNKLKEFTGKASEAGNKLKEVGGNIKDVGDKFTNATKVGAGMFVGALANSVQLSDVTSNLNIALGATGAEVIANNDLFDDLYSTGIAGAEETANAIVLVKQQFKDLDDGAVSELSKQALSLSKSMGVDTTDSIRAASIMAENFGITGEKAYDLIAYGMSNGLNKSGDFLDTLSEYSVEYKSAGLSAEEFVGMLEKSANAGIFNTDKAADAIREVQNQIGSGSDDVSEKLGQLGLDAGEIGSNMAAGGDLAKTSLEAIAKNLNAVEDLEQKNAIATTLFGSTWEDCGPAVLAQLDGIGIGLEGVDGAASRAADKVENSFGTRMSGIFATFRTELNDSFGPSAWTMFNELEPMMGELAAAIGPLIEGIGNALIAAMPTILDLVGKLTDWLSNLDSEKVESFASSFGLWIVALGPILSGLGGLIGFLGIVSSSLSGFIGFVTGTSKSGMVLFSVLGKIGTFLKGFGGFFTSAFGVVKGLLSGLAGVIMGVIQSAAAFFGLATGPFLAIVAVVIALVALIWYFRDEIFAAFKFVGDMMILGFKTIWDGIKAFFAGAIEFLKGFGAFIVEIWNGFLSIISIGLSTIWEGIKSFFAWFGELLLGIATGIAEAWNSFTSVIKDGLTAVWEAIKELASGVVETMKDIVDKVLAVWDSITKKVKDVVDGIKKKLSEIKFPHLSLSGEADFTLKDGDGFALPSVDVNWYAKGGVFDGPSVIGVGEKGPEAAVPLQGPRMGPFAEAIASQMDEKESPAKGGGDIIISGNWSIREESDIKKIARELMKLSNREFRMKGI